MRTIQLLAIVFLYLCSPAAADVIFDWAVVGNPGNTDDPGPPYGGVSYVYRIAKHEVTNNQYAEFLNRVASADPNGLFNSSMDISRSGSSGSFSYLVKSGFENKPVNFVSFFDGMRFVNWLENGQPTGAQGVGTTEAGVYAVGDGLSETRAAGATFFIPSEDEWYKAAFHDPRLETAGGPPGDDNYWAYPNRSDMVPTAELPPGGANSVNMDWWVGDTSNVGAYTDSMSFYGTFDQGGNVAEWNDDVLGPGGRRFRGGAWNDGVGVSGSGVNGLVSPSIEFANRGFRVVHIPDPIAGDANCDGMVDYADATILATNWQTLSGATWAMGDFNDDYAVNDIDATIMAANWQSGASGAVPEPGTLTLLATCGLTLLGLGTRRRKR